VKGTRGKIVSPGTNVTFYAPGIGAVRLNGLTAPSLSTGIGWVRVSVAAGTYDLEISN
jgi:hypothetical protein